MPVVTQHASKNAERQAAMRRRKQAWLSEVKTRLGCARCSERDPVVLTFDHLRPEEKHPRLKVRRRENGDFNVAPRALWSLPWADMFVEVEKCQVLCANDHMRVEAERRACR